jgi:peptidoglycan/LPS O-acetylase OafA/YrhL
LRGLHRPKRCCGTGVSTPTVVLGLPVPTDDPTFLGFLRIHIAAGLICVVTGGLAAIARKRQGLHTRAGVIYCISLCAVFATSTVMSTMRWAEDRHLFFIGTAAFGSGALGYLARKRQRGRWLRIHIPSMALSYVALLTGFYVDNGPNLPGWRLLPHAAFWILPSLIGAPLVIRALRKWTPS